MIDLDSELDKKAYHLRTLSDISQEIFFLKEPKEILPKLLLMVMGSYGSIRGLVFLLDEAQAALEASNQRGADISLQVELAQLISSNGKFMTGIDQPIHLNAAEVLRGDNVFLNFLTLNEFVLFNPMKFKNKLIGGLALGEKLLGEPYNADDLELLNTLVNQGAISVENARLQQEHINQERLHRELEIATDIQLSFLPSKQTVAQGLDLAAFFQPAREVGGDFYDFFELPDKKLGIVIADVCGKGLPAALHMALTRALIRACSTHEPENMIKAVLCTNSLIQQCASTDLFVTLLFSIYDPITGKLRYVRAGHNYPIFYSKSKNNFELLSGEGVALGAFSNIILEEKEIYLKSGDIIVFYTDGITEAINSDEEMFGVERIERLLVKYQDWPANLIADKIKSNVVEFEGIGRQSDDLTLIILKKNKLGA
ncbi:MAG: SpoIIE family protein phosphatase [Desulfobulbia bacterium]